MNYASDNSSCVVLGCYIDELNNIFDKYNIKKETFDLMLKDYYSREKEYAYYEIEEWVKLQYIWYPLIAEEKKVEKKELETTSIFKPTLVDRIFVNVPKKTVAIKFKDGTSTKATKQSKAKKFDEWDVFTTFAIAYTKRFCNMSYFIAKVVKQLSKKGNDKFEM